MLGVPCMYARGSLDASTSYTLWRHHGWNSLTVGSSLSLQVCGDMVGISAVVAAMLGLSVLLLTGVLTWRDCLTYPPAWDTLFWFAVLVGARS